jgi:hypothetical protein
VQLANDPAVGVDTQPPVSHKPPGRTVSIHSTVELEKRLGSILIWPDLGFDLTPASILLHISKSTERVAEFADMLSAMGTESRLRIMQLLLSAHPDGLSGCYSRAHERAS